MKIKISKIHRSYRKTLSLTISSRGDLIVKAPYSLSESDIWQFIDKKREWIKKKREDIRKNKSNSYLSFNENSLLPYFGKYYPILVSKKYKSSIVFDNAFCINKNYKKDLKRLIKNWFKFKSKDIIPEKLSKINSQFHLRFNSVKISNAEKRWGSCSGNGNLNFSWKTIMLPERIINYIIIHELAHLNELNHSSRFWKEVKAMEPNYIQHEKWLRKNSYKFRIYDT